MLTAPAFAASPTPTEQHHITTVVRADAKTGRLVRSVVPEPRPAAAVAEPAASVPPPAVAAEAPKDQTLNEMIDSIADSQGVESPLVHSVIKAESNYHANAVSPKGAQGIMQLIPSTARRFGVSDTFDTRQNIEGGVRYLRFLLDYFQGDYPKAIAAYNAGEHAVDKYKGIPPYAETQNYVYKVARNLKAAREERAQSVSAAVIIQSPSTPAVNGETIRHVVASVGSDGLVYYRTP